MRNVSVLCFVTWRVTLYGIGVFALKGYVRRFFLCRLFLNNEPTSERKPIESELFRLIYLLPIHGN